jgi:cytochrome c2
MLLALLVVIATQASAVVSVKDPSDGTIHDYRGTPLLALLPPPPPIDAPGDAVLVRCSDGFVVLLPLSVIRDYQPVVASEVRREQRWMPIPTPRGPRYLVWPNLSRPELEQDPAITSEGWAWGVDEVSVLASATYLAPLTPLRTDPSVERGRALWMQSCFHCHAVHHTGGLVGWDLSAPVALWTYRSEADVARYLRDPRAVNPSGHMPAQVLTPKQQRDLFAYMHAVLP